MELLINIIDIMIINIYFKAFSNTHKKVSKNSIYLTVFILSLGMLLTTKQNIYILKLAYFIFILVIFSLLYTGNVTLKIFIALIYIASATISETFSLDILVLLKNISIVGLNYDVLNSSPNILSVGIRILIALFLVKNSQNIIPIVNKFYYWICGLLLAVSAGCIILMHFIKEREDLLSSALNGFMLLIILGITFCFYFITKTLLTSQHRTQSQEAAYKKEYYALLKLHYDKLEMNQAEGEILTSNYIVNYVCSTKFQIAKENHIQVHSEFMLPNFLDMDTTDLSVLYESLLDNAIKACLSLNKEERSIYFYTSYNSGQLYIKIYNPYMNESELDANHERELELVDVKGIVDKYKGFIDIKRGNQIFEVDLVIFLSN